jgi:hypothetical protein
VLHHRLRWPSPTTRDNRDVDDGGTTTAAPAATTVVVAPAATPLSLLLTTAMATPRGPSTSTPGPAPFKCGLDGGGGVDVQQPLSSAMLVDALTYGLPPHQADPTFAPPLAHPPPTAWTPWMTPDALTYGLPPQQAGLTFAPPLAHPPPVAWTPWTTSNALPYGLPS